MATSPAFTRSSSAALGGPQWLRKRRAAAIEEWEAADLPTEAEEMWRYSRIGELDFGVFSLDRDAPAMPEHHRDPAGESAFPNTAALAWAQDGHLSRADIATGPGSAGLAVTSVRTATASDGPGPLRAESQAREMVGTVALAHDALGWLAEAFVDDIVVVSVPDGLVVVDPIVVVHWIASGAEGAHRLAVPRTLLVAGEGSVATIVEITASATTSKAVPAWPGSHAPAQSGSHTLAHPATKGASWPRHLSLPITEVLVGNGAHLTYVAVQDLSTCDWQIARQSSTVGRDACFESFTASLGGDYSRFRSDNLAAGSGSESRLTAGYLATGTQMHDFRTLQDHNAPHTVSSLYFKGAIADEARSVYSGLIRIRKGATRSDATQENRNLVLSPDAHAESVPNLEIEENDVRCSHASTVGPIDPDQRYYLESRGISSEEAEQLIVEGFFSEIIGRLDGVPAVRSVVGEYIQGKLESMKAAPENSGC